MTVGEVMQMLDVYGWRSQECQLDIRRYKGDVVPPFLVMGCSAWTGEGIQKVWNGW